MKRLQLSQPTFKFGQRTVTVSWNEPLDNYGDARGAGACTVAAKALESVSVAIDPCCSEMAVLHVSWPGHSLTAHMTDFRGVPFRELSEAEAARILSDGYASGRERCQEIATRLREAMENA